jgi:multidrug efflux pump subunit AcrA (membrane-fusion protein)
VLVVDDKNIVKMRPVKLGPLQPGGLRVILEGITRDDWVIVNGIQRARPEAPVTPQKAEMPVRLPSTRPAASQPASTQPAK